MKTVLKLTKLKTNLTFSKKTNKHVDESKQKHDFFGGEGKKQNHLNVTAKT